MSTKTNPITDKITPRLLIFTAVFLFISFIRIHRITESPPGFYKDEAGIAVNGYSILTTARDEYGRFLPLFFENFGDFKEPIFVYSQLPVMLFLGESIIATRITSALWGLATVLAFTYLTKLVLKKDTIALSGMIIMGLMPWHIHFSRIGFQLITLPFLFTLFLIFFYKFSKAQQAQRVTYLTYITVTLGLMFYSYYAGRYLGAVYLAYIYWQYHTKIKRKYFFRAGIIFIAILAPALVFDQLHPNTLTSRFNAVSIIQSGASIKQTINLYISGYLQHYSLDFWFVRGDTNLRHSVQFHYPLLWSAIPIAITGLYTLMRKRQHQFNRLIIFSLLTFPVVSALTTNAPHVHRVIFMVPVVGYILVIGLKEIAIIIRKRSYLFQYAVTTIWFIFLIFELVEVYDYYFNDYTFRSKAWFHVQDIEAIDHLLKYPKPHIVSKEITEYWLSSYHLLAKTPPNQIQQETSQVFLEYIQPNIPKRNGYYLMKENDCQIFTDIFPKAKLEEVIDRRCIYHVSNL